MSMDRIARGEGSVVTGSIGRSFLCLLTTLHSANSLGATHFITTLAMSVTR